MKTNRNREENLIVEHFDSFVVVLDFLNATDFVTSGTKPFYTLELAYRHEANHTSHDILVDYRSQSASRKWK